MYFDTHSHPYLAKEKSQEAILESFFSSWGLYLNSIGCDIKSSQTSINLAKSYKGVFASIWIHPTHCLEYKDTMSQTINQLRILYKENKKDVIAIWETWLDYYWIKQLSEKYSISQDSIKKIQRDFFIAQIELASELNLPLIIHNRNAKDDVLSILVEQDFKNFVFHCYSEDLDYATKLLEFAPICKLGFWGVVSFKNAYEVQNTAKNIPLTSIILETDSPYLTPTPFRWKEENEPLLVKYVLSKLIELREESSDCVKNTILSNSVDFFNIEK